jgi:hypothetical protein
MRTAGFVNGRVTNGAGNGAGNGAENGAENGAKNGDVGVGPIAAYSPTEHKRATHAKPFQALQQPDGKLTAQPPAQHSALVLGTSFEQPQLG